MNNLFFPIYKKIENEFVELSYAIYVNKKQLSTYSVKIADLILRTVSECENIALELCKKEKIDFKDKKGKNKVIVCFADYVHQLNKMYNLKEKMVSFDFNNCEENLFDSQLVPFSLVKIKDGSRVFEDYAWHYSYNKIKHDRNKFFEYANLNNLINGMAALFLLNNYALDEYFYSLDGTKISELIKEIESKSNIFSVTITPDVNPPNDYKSSFPDRYKYIQAALPYSTYLIKMDEICETGSDKAMHFRDQLKNMAYCCGENEKFVKLFPNLKGKKYQTKCKVVIKLNKVY